MSFGVHKLLLYIHIGYHISQPTFYIIHSGPYAISDRQYLDVDFILVYCFEVNRVLRNTVFHRGFITILIFCKL